LSGSVAHRDLIVALKGSNETTTKPKERQNMLLGIKMEAQCLFYDQVGNFTLSKLTL
jgi:hypothetical protein